MAADDLGAKAMTPAEREALKIAAQKARDTLYGRDEKGWVIDRWFRTDASPEVILSLLDLISTLELTLSNATRVGVVQIDRIAALESSAKDFIAAVERVEPHINAMIGLQYARNRTEYKGPNYIEQKAFLRALIATRNEHPKSEASGKWVSVQDRMPDVSELPVLAYASGYPDIFAEHNGRKVVHSLAKSYNWGSRITHWQPLDPIPEEKR